MNKPFYILYLLFSLCFCCETKSQINLVPNGSFEDTVNCPNTTGAIIKCKYWYDPNSCSSDYFNTCSPIYTDISAPQNFAGYQYPRTGNAYAGLYVYSSFFTTSLREAIAIELSETLKKNVNYCVKFYVSLADSMYYAINKISLAFTKNKYFDSVCNFDNINLIPQINSNGNFITSKTDWIEISSDYIANGEENFLIITNFQSNSQLDTLFLNNGGLKTGNNIASYYYIDDVSIIKCDSNNEFYIPNIFTPNSDYVNDVWKVEDLKNEYCIIYNRWGNKIYETQNNNIKWDGRTTNGELCPDGAYFYYIKTKETYYKGFIQLMR